jgi:hypothetical protein
MEQLSEFLRDELSGGVDTIHVEELHFDFSAERAVAARCRAVRPNWARIAR